MAAMRPGKVLNVKVELAPELVGFGRATVVEERSDRLFLKLKEDIENKRTLPRGIKVWFVREGGDTEFNGLWSVTLLNADLVNGETVLECTAPKFETHVQRRRLKRIAVQWPLRLHGVQYEKLTACARNLSSSGMLAEILGDHTQLFTSGHNIDFSLDTSDGSIEGTARVVQARFNWLANKTNLGFEFVRLGSRGGGILNSVLKAIAQRQELAPAGKDVPSGAPLASTAAKSGKQNVSFQQTAENKLRELISEDEIDQLSSSADDDGADG